MSNRTHRHFFRLRFRTATLYAFSCDTGCPKTAYVERSAYWSHGAPQ